MDRDRHMAFLFDIIERYGFKDMIEMDSDKEGDLLPVMYPFGYQFAKSSAIRFKSEEKTIVALWTLRGNRSILYAGPDGSESKVWVKWGYDGRSLKDQPANFN